MKLRTILKKYNIIISNFLSLFVLQGLNYILPLITVPYLVRTLGPEKYGVIVFATAFITYFQVVTDYGFNLSATRRISINRNNKSELDEIFSSVMLIKFVLTIMCFIFFIIIVLNFKKFQGYYKIYIYTYGMVIGNFLFPIWFFQGMERMKYITIVNVLGKLFFTVLIFILVRSSVDYLKVAWLNSLSFIMIGIISLLIVYFKFKIRFKMPTIEILKRDLKEGWYIFTTSFLTNILTSTGTFVLGLFTTEKIVGYYGAIDKVVKAFVSMSLPVTQAIFPHISEMFKNDYESGKNEVVKFAKYVMLFTTIMCLIIAMFNKNIIFILYGNKYNTYSHILKYMSIWIYLSILNNFIGIQYLIGSGNGKYYSKSFTISAVITLGLFLILIKFISYNAIIIGSILGELALTLAMIYYIKFNKITNGKLGDDIDG